MMILQRVRRHKPYIGVCYANDPQKGGGFTTLAPALDLTTSLLILAANLKHWKGRMGKSMVGNNQPNVPAIDTFSH